MTLFRYTSMVHGFRIIVVSSLIVAGMSVACNTSPQAKEARFLRKGAALLEKKDYSRALLEFKNAAAVMPKDAEPYYQMGIAFLNSGSPTNGVAALRKATELNPHHERAQVKLAELMASTKNKDLVQEAAGRLEGVLSTSPNNSEASDALALAEWKLGKTEDATNRLEETLRKFPSHLQTSVELARLKLAQKDFGAAEQVLKQAVASDPKSSAAESALGQLYMLANEPVEAEVELRKSVQLDPKNGTAMLGLAAIQLAGNRTEEAEQTYRQVSALPEARFKPLHALFLYRTGKRDAALAELEKLAKQTPDDREAQSRLVAAYRAMGKTQAVKALVAVALKKNPNNTDALFQRAQLSLQDGHADEAAKDLTRVLHFKPDSSEAHVAMADVYKVQGLIRNERQELSEALRLNPSLLPARLALARTLTVANEAKSAVELLNAAPANQKAVLAVVVEKNWALLSLGGTKEARSNLDQALRVSRFPDLVVQDAILRLQAGDYAGARSNIEEVLQKNPKDVRALRILVQSYMGEKQPGKAEERLKALAAANPQSAPLANFLGEWYMSNKNDSDARKAFEAAQAADPKFVPNAVALANLDYREEHLEAARQRLLQVIAKDSKNVQALLMLGALEGEMRDRPDAVERYRAVLAIDGSNLMALNNLAFTLAFSDPDDALKYAQQAAELAPDNAAIQDTLGWVYYRKAVYTTAVQYLEAAVAKEPTPRRQFHLAMSYLKTGNRDLGTKTLQLALQKAPGLIKTEEGW